MFYKSFSKYHFLQPFIIKIGNYPVAKVSVEYQSPDNICEALIRGKVGYFDVDDDEQKVIEI